VDSDDPGRIQESKEALHQIYLHPQLKGKPLLMLVCNSANYFIRFCNKKDGKNPMTNQEIFDKLELKALFPNARTFYDHEFEISSAFKLQESTGIVDQNQVSDERLKAGIRWLIERVKSQRKR